MTTQRLIRWPELQMKVGKSRTTIWREEREGRFPRRIQTGKNIVAWLESEIDDWIKARCSESEKGGRV